MYLCICILCICIYLYLFVHICIYPLINFHNWKIIFNALAQLLGMDVWARSGQRQEFHSYHQFQGMYILYIYIYMYMCTYVYVYIYVYMCLYKIRCAKPASKSKYCWRYQAAKMRRSDMQSLQVSQNIAEDTKIPRCKDTTCNGCKPVKILLKIQRYQDAKIWHAKPASKSK